ncbi:hypothetical protein ACQR0V_27440 [Bradyrhizobium sp. HKCCYLS2058]|uniref:hypothetical protein n=1 Tax=unclassified Bradyrhizobium TaxID=2631580 RepID=UPI003EBE6992
MEETISLYLDLKPGQKPDLEVVGLAAAAFSEAIKEIAYVLDPGLEVRLEFDSGTEGSLSLNAVLKVLKSRDGQRGTLLGIVIGISMAFVGDVRQWGSTRLLDYYFPKEEHTQLDASDIARIASACQKVSEGKIASDPIRRVYKELDRDDVITSVGTITKPKTKPPAPVPHSEFQIRAGVIERVETSPRTRKAYSTERLTLVSPVLLSKVHRVWRFMSPFGEFGYLMEDEKFVSDLLTGKRRLTMKEGIQITAKIETDEIFEADVWVPKQRHITKIIKVHKKTDDADLFSQPVKRNAGKKKKS